MELRRKAMLKASVLAVDDPSSGKLPRRMTSSSERSKPMLCMTRWNLADRVSYRCIRSSFLSSRGGGVGEVVVGGGGVVVVIVVVTIK